MYKMYTTGAKVLLLFINTQLQSVAIEIQTAVELKSHFQQK